MFVFPFSNLNDLFPEALSKQLLIPQLERAINNAGAHSALYCPVFVSFWAPRGKATLSLGKREVRMFEAHFAPPSPLLLDSWQLCPWCSHLSGVSLDKPSTLGG